MTSETSRTPVRPSRPRWARRVTVPSQVVPGLDPDWADAFLVELRLADVPGRAIGDALAEVGSHCAESGESPRDAFGDPVQYARSLGLPPGPDVATPLPGSVLPWGTQALGLLLVAAAATPLAAGEPFAVTTGYLAVAVLLAAGLVALQRWGAEMLRLVVRRPVVAWLAAMAHVGLLVAVLALLDGVVARVPAAAALAAGGAALLAGTVWVLAVLRREVVDDDPVTAPLAPAAPRGSLGVAVLRYGPALLPPVVALGFVALGLLGD
jgi:hypothetical protein